MQILRTKSARLVTTAVLTLGAAGAAIATGAGPASAMVRPNYYHCGNNGSGVCTNIKSGGARFYNASNVYQYTINGNTQVEVTCWYLSGGQGDGYFDHLSWVASHGNVSGHVLDDTVNLNGQTPPQAGIPQC